MPFGKARPGHVLLFLHEEPEIKIHISAYFDNRGDLAVDGYDVGTRVEELIGDSDYEYMLTVKRRDLRKLSTALDTSHDGLLSALQERFSGNKSYSSIRDFLKEEDIAFVTSSSRW